MDGEIKGCGVPKLDRSTKPAKGTISHMDGRTQSYRRPFRRLPAGKAARSAAKTIPRIQNSDPRDIDAVFRPVKALFLFCGAVGGSNSAFLHAAATDGRTFMPVRRNCTFYSIAQAPTVFNVIPTGEQSVCCKCHTQTRTILPCTGISSQGRV